MSTEYNTGLVVQDDGKGGIEVVKAFDDAVINLNKHIKQANAEFGALDKSFQSFASVAASIKPGIDEVNSSIKSLGDNAKSAQEAVGELGEGSEQANEGSSSLAKGFGSVISAASLVGGAISGVIGVFGSFADALRHDAIGELKTLSDSLDVSVESLSTWGYAAESLGVSSQDLGRIFKDTSTQLGNLAATGKGKAKDLFEDLGLSINELKELSPDQQLLAIADGLEKIGSQSEKVFYLENLSVDAAKLLPLLEDGATGLRKMQREADLLGYALDNADAAQVAAISDTFRVLGGISEGFANQLTIQLAPAFSGVSDGILNVVEHFGGMENIVNTVVTAAVHGIGFILNTIHGLNIILTTSKLGWSQMAEVAIGAMANSADATAKLINLALAPLQEILASTAEGWGYLLVAAGSFLGEAGKGLEDVGQGLQSFAEKTRDFTVNAEDIRAAEESIKSVTAETADELVRMKQSAPGDKFVADMEAARVKLDAQAVSTKLLSDANSTAADEAKKVTDQTDKQKTATDAQTTATNEAKKSIDAETESLKSSKKAKDDDAKSTEEQKKKTLSYKSALEDVTGVLDKALTDNWLDLLQGNADGFFGSVEKGFGELLDGYKEMLAAMAKETIANPLIANVKAGVSTFLSSSGANYQLGQPIKNSAGQIDFGNLLSYGDSLIGGGLGGSIMGIGNTLAGWGTAQGWSTLGAFGSGIGSTGAILGTQGLFGGFGTALSNIGSLFGSGSIVGGIGAALPIVGIVAGAAQLVDSLSGGKLFGSDWEYDDHGLNLSYSGGNFSGNNYTTEVKQRSLFRGRKWRTEESALDVGVASQMDAYFDGIENLVRGAASELEIDRVTQVGSRLAGESMQDILGQTEPGQNVNQIWQGMIQSSLYEYEVSLEDYLANFTSDFSLSLKDMSDEDAQKAIQEWADNTTNELIGSIFGDALEGLSREGETLAATLERVMIQLELVDGGFNAVNLSLSQLAATAGVSELTFSNDVVEAAGGAEQLSALLQNYQSSYFTQEELLSKQLGEYASTVLGYTDAIGFTIGDDFRAQFEAAQNNGLSAEDVVQWLQTGSVISQFEALAEELASLTGESVDDVISNVLNQSTAAVIDAVIPESGSDEADDKEGKPEDVIDTEDPVVSQVAALNEAINDQVGGSNEHLASIDKRLVELNDSMTMTLEKFTHTVTDMLADNDASIKVMQSEISNVARIAKEASVATADMIHDVTRLVVDLAPKGEPVINTEVL